MKTERSGKENTCGSWLPGAAAGWVGRVATSMGHSRHRQYDYIIRQGGRAGDARWPHDLHWSPTGHRWAAEALLEYLKQHPETCGGAVAGGTH